MTLPTAPIETADRSVVPAQACSPLSGLETAWWQNLAMRLIASLPSTRVLHVGADTAPLVDALVRHGIDAVGHIVSKRTPPARHAAADRLTSGPFQPESHPKHAFSTVVWNARADAEGVEAIEDLLQAVSHLCARHALLLFDQREDQPVSPAVRRRLQEGMFAHGFRRHPAALRMQAYDERLDDTRILILTFERRPDLPSPDVPDAPDASIHWLADPLISTTHAAADLAARYALAAEIVRRDDIVVNASCGAGAGAGAAILHDSSACGAIIVPLADANLARGVRAAYGGARPRLDIRETGSEPLAAIDNHSAHLIVAVDPTGDPRANDSALLRQSIRILIPGGRIVVAAPAARGEGGQSDEGGLTKAALVAALEPFVRVETLFAQSVRTATNGQVTRRLEALTGQHADDEDADWWIAVALKDPIAHQTPRPEELALSARAGTGGDLLMGAQGYQNPWLTRGLVLMSRRTTSPTLLIEFALRTLEQAPGYGTDRGAALCVLAYRALEGGRSSVPDVPLETWLDAYIHVPPSGPLEARWCISNAYALGQMRLVSGDMRGAEEAFARCAYEEIPSIAPTLAVKTVGAALRAGWLAVARGDRDAAGRHWRQGRGTARLAVRDRWDEYLGDGDVEAPLWGHNEAGQILVLAGQCQRALAWLDREDDRRGDVGGLDLVPESILFPGRATAGAAPKPAAPQPDAAQLVALLLNGPPGRPLYLWSERTELEHALLDGTPGRPLYLWGAGALGERFARLAGHRFARVTGVVDSSPQKQGGTMAGRPIVAPEALALSPGSPRPFIVITSQFAHEIVPWLLRLGYECPDDVFVFPSGA